MNDAIQFRMVHDNLLSSVRFNTAFVLIAVSNMKVR